MPTIDGTTLKRGHPLLIEFQPGELSRFQEPLGRLFTRNKEEVEFPPERRPPGRLFEAYGYDPDNPSATPSPLWGDHYVKLDRKTGRPKTGWADIKATANREVFLRKWSDHMLEGTLYLSRARKYPKFICPEYHKHLLRTYEAVWAITEAIRERARDKRILPTRWTLDTHDVSKIFRLAQKHSSYVLDGGGIAYRSQTFIEMVLHLEREGQAPHYQPRWENVEQYAAEMFEVIMAEFVRSYFGYSFVRHMYRPSFLNGEVDIYASDSGPEIVQELVGSCKLRVTSKDPLAYGEVANLAKRLDEARTRARGDAKGRKVVTFGVLFTNAGYPVDQSVRTLAEEKNIAVLFVKLPPWWVDKPTMRSEKARVSEKHIAHLGGIDVAQIRI